MLREIVPWLWEALLQLLEHIDEQILNSEPLTVFPPLTVEDIQRHESESIC